ncbi:MAG: dihydrodipicolinate synthase family protein [Caldilineaceae bacterium]
MALDNAALLDALNSVTAIPIIPFKNGRVNYAGHAKNVTYLMRQNRLENQRPRVIAIAGTSLIHHLSAEEQTRVIDETGRAMGSAGVLMAAVVPNPFSTARQLLEAQLALPRTPDVFLVMPLTGVASRAGMFQAYLRLGEHYGKEYGARFLYYLRNSAEREVVIRLLNESPHWIGVKVGTNENDVKPLLEGVGQNGMVIWGVGDRATKAAELGAKGHTSGIAILYAGASDAINNAHRRGDFATAHQVEAAISPLEELRFMDNRIHNYSAVVEAMILSGFTDIEGGEGGPFNPRVPGEVAEKVKAAIQNLAQYH